MQRLKTGENGKVVSPVDPAKYKTDIKQAIEIKNPEFVTVLQTMEDIPVVENTDFIYFNVVESLDCTK